MLIFCVLIYSKFHSGAPWPLAQAELLKLNKFRAPYDKYMCISWAWEIIGHYVSLLDDPAPDALGQLWRGVNIRLL